MSIIYTMGDMAAVTPLYNYNFHVIAYEAAAGSGGGWRDLFTWIGIPGFAIALLMMLTVREPRHENEGSAAAAAAAAAAPGSKGLGPDGVQGSAGPAAAGVSVTDPSSWREGASNLSAQLLNMVTGHGWHSSSSSVSSNSSEAPPAAAAAAAEPELLGPACIVELDDGRTPAAAAAATTEAVAPTAAAEEGPAAAGEAPTALAVASSTAAAASTALVAKLSHNPVSDLLSMKAFQATTIAAALNDVGSYALIAWHSTFYERVFGLDSGVYAPMLAVILPVGGILGGVGGGLIADWLSVVGGRYWLTAGVCRYCHTHCCFRCHVHHFMSVCSGSKAACINECNFCDWGRLGLLVAGCLQTGLTVSTPAALFTVSLLAAPTLLQAPRCWLRHLWRSRC
jgi:hypothetical protein